MGDKGIRFPRGGKSGTAPDAADEYFGKLDRVAYRRWLIGQALSSCTILEDDPVGRRGAVSVNVERTVDAAFALADEVVRRLEAEKS